MRTWFELLARAGRPQRDAFELRTRLIVEAMRAGMPEELRAAVAASEAFETHDDHPELHLDHDTALTIRKQWERQRPKSAADEEPSDTYSDGFVYLIEGVATYMRSVERREPPTQEVRRQRLNQLAGAILRLQEALVNVDRESLTWLFDDALASLKAQDGESSVYDAPAAHVLAGSLRADAMRVLPGAALIAQRAASTLPPYNRLAEDSRLLGAIAIESLFTRTLKLKFETKDSGLAATCFRAAYELANPDKRMERPKYWLEKALEERRFSKELPERKSAP